jgi:hypothetical protein
MMLGHFAAHPARGEDDVEIDDPTARLVDDERIGRQCLLDPREVGRLPVE